MQNNEYIQIKETTDKLTTLKIVKILDNSSFNLTINTLKNTHK